MICAIKDTSRCVLAAGGVRLVSLNYFCAAVGMLVSCVCVCVYAPKAIDNYSH